MELLIVSTLVSLILYRVCFKWGFSEGVKQGQLAAKEDSGWFTPGANIGGYQPVKDVSSDPPGYSDSLQQLIIKKIIAETELAELKEQKRRYVQSNR